MVIRLTMGTKLALAISFFLAISLGAMAYLGNNYFREQFTHSFFMQQQVLTDALASEIESKVRIFGNELVSVALDLDPEILTDRYLAQQYLNGRKDTTQIFDNGIFLVNRSGRIVASTHGHYYETDSDFSNNVVIRDSLQQTQALISEPQVIPGEDHDSLLFTAPLYDEAMRIAGLLVGSLNLSQDNFIGHLATMRFEAGGHLHLSSRAGKTIAGKAVPEIKEVLQQMAQENVDRKSYHGLIPAQGRDHGLLESNVERVLVTNMVLHETGWKLATMFPARVLFAPLEKAQRFFGWLLAVLVVGSALLIGVISHILTRPLKRFSDQLRGFLGTGILPTRVEVPARGEVGILGRIFNDLIGEIEQIHRQLEQKHERLKQTQSQLLHQEKMASVGQLAAGVAHEINNPMGFISSNLRSLKRYTEKTSACLASEQLLVAESSDTELGEKLATLRRKSKIDLIMKDIPELIDESLEGAERVKGIVINLKTFARVDEAEQKTADLNDCLESTLKIAWNELKYNATLEKEYGKLPLLPCNPQQLNQVFLNLLINAGHAIEKEGTIKIRTWASENAVHVMISDTGCGMPPEVCQRVFEPFYTTKEVGKGTGLGLSIAYEIIGKHGGSIDLESQPGVGTTFTINLPLEPPTTNEASAKGTEA